MSSEKMKGIVDIPIQQSSEDAFGINKYVSGLIEFIRNTETPITIALQGEWGSGKTSLMNTLKYELCENNDNEYTGIWINTWQYSLMKDPEQTLISIIVALTDEITILCGQKSNQKVKEALVGLLKTSINVASKFTGTNITIEDFIKNENKFPTIKILRDSLNEVINNNRKKFIFFIDDLDRLEPHVAVYILELLKNIFDLNNSIFILAIDYDVVVKGLEPKFGKLSQNNEREFRSFFDKIIQLPFTMPLGSYAIDDFLITNLIKIGFLNIEDVKEAQDKELFSDIARYSVGTNPRSLKRMLNSLSLVVCINKTNHELNKKLTESSLFKIFNFSLMCIQIAFPQIYLVLQKFPDFPNWDNFASKMDLPEINKDTVEKLRETEQFDEDWEQVLYRICEKDNNIYLKRNALNISTLLNLLKKHFNNCIETETEKHLTLESIVRQSIGLSAVTSVNTSDNQIKVVDSDLFLRELVNKIFEKIKTSLPDKKISKNGKIIAFDNIEFDFRAPHVFDSNKPDDRRMCITHKTRNDKDAQQTKELLETLFMKAKPKIVSERYISKVTPNLMLYNYVIREKEIVKEFYEEKMVDILVEIIFNTNKVIEEIKKLS